MFMVYEYTMVWDKGRYLKQCFGLFTAISSDFENPFFAQRGRNKKFQSLTQNQ